MSSFTEASSSSSATPIVDAEKVSTDCHVMSLSQKYCMHDDHSDHYSNDAKVRLSFTNHLPESAQQQQRLSEHERLANSIQLNKLKGEQVQVQEQIKARDATITLYEPREGPRKLQLEQISAQMSSEHLDETHAHTAEMQRLDEEKQALLREIARMELKNDKLEEEADVMRNRAFTAEGQVQLVEAKLKSAASQLEEAQKRNQFFERKVVQMETHIANKEFEYKEKEQQLEAALLQSLSNPTN
ncbi:hypothetical protein FisN_11Lu213 [Fistulifera solaris]|uniref:Uncharacterized protein n=1 Tax=Fistulifera solaris TaxID=1519565 RepID=A0A1Z5J756_FISSO|nr:hypothetical protein FisN_11Lu213 [Fistulifera solaris]|eukprot:GAX09813.1 hypothetical protein FisN_11Lu213 [Fistulifera solaris]